MKILSEEIKKLLVDTIDREDISLDDLNNNTLLFEGGLELDSIDVLELAVAIQVKYGFNIDPEADDVQTYFKTVASLIALIASNNNDRGRI
ncbi:MAG: acyl carrier protein [Nitrosomonadaceae bacterium]|jgi:acyl carrier protein|nr:acyl carrier protein [Nitrosomonadaceae bacterium]